MTQYKPRQLSYTNTVHHMGKCDDNLDDYNEIRKLCDEWGDKLLSEIDSIIQEFEGNLLIEKCGGRGGECPYQHIWNKRKTKGIILEKHCGDKWAKKGLLTSQYTTGRGRLLEEWRDASVLSVLGWTKPFGKTSNANFRRQFDLRGKSKEDLRKIIRLIIE